jgi:DNA mismatch repair protein MutL
MTATATPAAVPAGGSSRVRVLPPEVADKIAAGEVIERPAAVVKELVENAIDAGARQVDVTLEDAGLGLIAVVDDGEGMTPDDAVCAFSRHATSKVSSADDLWRITTLGFRGEALASIAAVSTTTLTTRRAADLAGARVVIRAGSILEMREAGTPPGTRVDVTDLFGNTPARRKFLKAPATEVGHVTELVTRIALAFHTIGFSVRHGTRRLLEFPATGEPHERVAQVFGRERAAEMLPFSGRSLAGDVHGWLTGSHLSFPTARQIYTFVNRRYVRDKLVSHALTAGYSTLLMHGRYPAAVVHLELLPEEVDVNVHPAKSEVRFRRGGAVHELLSHAVQERLRSHTPVSAAADPPSVAGTPGPVSGLQMPMALRAAAGWGGSPDAGAPKPVGSTGPTSWRTDVIRLRSLAPEQTMPHPPVAPDAPSEAQASESGYFASMKVVGQVFEGYLVCQRDEALVLIDQHAAHERVAFERLRRAYGCGRIPQQGLLVPAVVELGPREAALLADRLEELYALGFEIEPFGNTSFAVRAVPALLADADPAALVRDVVDECAEVGGSRRLTDAAEAVLARLACHSVVRVGQTLGPDQIRALLAAMDGIPFSGNCPHGRPAYITLSRGELERLFKRV